MFMGHMPVLIITVTCYSTISFLILCSCVIVVFIQNVVKEKDPGSAP
jgi:hypothetical protein